MGPRGPKIDRQIRGRVHLSIFPKVSPGELHVDSTAAKRPTVFGGLEAEFSKLFGGLTIGLHSPAALRAKMEIKNILGPRIRAGTGPKPPISLWN